MKQNCTVIIATDDISKNAEVLFRPMIDWVIDCVRNCGFDDNNICVLTGQFIFEARDFISSHSGSNVLILRVDAPLIDEYTVLQALEYHENTDSAVTVISANAENSAGYGRIIRDENGTLCKIAEESNITEKEKSISEVSSGAYWFNCQSLLYSLDKLLNSAKKFHLSDTVEILHSVGQRTVAFKTKNSDALIRANDAVQLATLNDIARKKIIEKHMRNGVSIPFSDGVIIDPTVTIGSDTEILCGTILRNNTTIGKGCKIGPDTKLCACKIYDKCNLVSVYGESATVLEGTSIGPYSRLRPGTVIGKDVKIGNFVEIKNSNVGDNTKISHLSYVGDADIGKGVNIGCGFATANYSGKEKFRTSIGDGAFIGCDTSLVAPIKIGNRAYTAAGSTLTQDVPDDALALARAHQTIKKDWVKQKNPYKKLK